MQVLDIASFGRYAGIDALRAFAVLLVVVGHAGFISSGDAGVTVFFAISGYVITRSALREHDRTQSFQLGGFYWRRAIKLMPPFLVLILLPTILYAAFGGEVVWGLALSQLFFVYNWFAIAVPDAASLVLPGSNVVWSLAVEEQFYIVFAVFWLLCMMLANPRRALTVFAVVVFAASTVWRFVLAAAPENEYRILWGTDTRVDAIAAGVLLAVFLHRGQLGRRTRDVVYSGWPLILALLAFFASFLVRDQWFIESARYSIHTLISVVLIASGVFAAEGGRVLRAFYRVSTWRFVSLVGVASYSIYLAHDVFIHLVDPLVQGLPQVLASTVLLVVGLTAGVLAYFAVEVPVLLWRRRGSRQRESSGAVG